MQFVLTFALLVSAGATDVTVLRWESPDSSKPLSFAEWRSGLQPRTWHVEPLVPASRFSNRIDFFVEETLVSVLQQSLDTLAADLVDDTTDVAIFSVGGTSAESLKALLAAEYQTGMTSAVLVGDLPIAWFQMIDDFNSQGANDGYEEFPCDLFFMDLDGTWKDSLVRLDTLDSLVPGSDSIYDVHEGDLTPEIAVSRLPASAIGDAESLLVSYFDKSHRYRNGQLPVPDRALVYVDDDWERWAAEWDSNVGLLYHDRVFISDPETTRIADYEPRIDSADYQWVALMSHSWPGGHAMKYDSGANWDYFYATWIPALDPQANFYNLFACSNVRFVEDGYCGGCYVFQTSAGLGAIGSTKTGSMLRFGDFYSPLGQDGTLGEAFREWFDAILEDGWTPSERSWFYGMCLVGDGTLKPRVSTTGIAETDASPLAPTAIRLLANPARNRVSFEFSLTQPAQCRVILIDLAGRTIATISQGAFSTGTHSLSTDVRSLPAGVYFLSVNTGGRHTRIPVSVVR
jgi:hypothetical protein